MSCEYQITAKPKENKTRQMKMVGMQMRTFFELKLYHFWHIFLIKYRYILLIKYYTKYRLEQ